MCIRDSSSLDRELVSSYKLNVSVSDGLFTTFAAVNIAVLDANDNSPVCTQSISIVSVSEGVTPGSDVLVVEATDADADDNGKLKYTVFGQGIGVFTIHNKTGLSRKDGFVTPALSRCPIEYEGEFATKLLSNRETKIEAVDPIPGNLSCFHGPFR